MANIFSNVEDITHYSKRTQAGNLRAAGVITDDVEEPKFARSAVPQNITIETAMKYYLDNAQGEYTNLYKATAKWLSELNSIPKSKLKENMKSVSVNEGDNNE